MAAGEYDRFWSPAVGALYTVKSSGDYLWVIVGVNDVLTCGTSFDRPLAGRAADMRVIELTPREFGRLIGKWN